MVAENEAGLSKPSETTGSFKAKDPYSLPARPEAPLVDSINADSASISWSPPVSDGGAPISNYILEYKPRSDVTWKVSGHRKLFEFIKP